MAEPPSPGIADAPATPAKTEGLNAIPEAWRRAAWMFAAFAGYSALAVAVTFPLVLHLGSRIPRDRQDSLWYVTTLWWNQYVTPLSDRWWDGFTFFPAPGAMAFSDHLLGASLIASPLQWIGCSPVTAYNLTFLASFPLCAIGAHALALTLTKRQDAALLCGLAYGFNPYRIAHLEHLELLMAFGMPAALAAAHRYASTRRPKWLAVFSVALAVQALSASYYALFFAVFVSMWLIWFIRPHAWRDGLAIIAAAAGAALVVVPILIGYSRIHSRHNLTRDFAEVLQYSADVSSFVTASALSALWGWTATWNGGERQLFPGLTITALAVVGALVLRRRQKPERDSWSTASRACWALAICLALIAVWAWIYGGGQFQWGWFRISISVPYKPLSLALAFAFLAIALSPTARTAMRQRSAVAFYLIAAAVCFLCSLGPRPTLLGEQVLYEPPYAWLMRLPFFADSGGSVPAVRVPARFAMLGILALCVAASLTFARLAGARQRRVPLVLLLLAGITADGWITGLPLRELPAAMPMPRNDPSVAVMELPLGEVRGDTAAMYRATLHGRPTVNGYHSFAPLSHHILKFGLADRDPTVLNALASVGPLLIATHKDLDVDGTWAAFVANHEAATQIFDDGTWTLFHLAHEPQPLLSRCGTESIPLVAVVDRHGDVDRAVLTDGRPGTRWITPGPQQAGDWISLDVGGVEAVCGLVLSMGAEAGFYPRNLEVATSLDGFTWTAEYVGGMSGATFLAALDNPRDARIFIPVNGKAARFVRLRAAKSDPQYPWAIADVLVRQRGDESS